MRPPSTATQQQCNNNNNNNNNNSLPLKINKDSHCIKKSSASSSASSSPPSHRHPVIIYTHSPKIIHTHPRDFMALVQKLTGLSRSNDNNSMENGNGMLPDEENNNYNNNNIKNGKISGNDDESTSVITTDENCVGGHIGDGQVNSCFVPPPIFEPPNPFLTNNIPVFTPNSADYLCSNQPFYTYTADSLLFSPNIRGAISSTSSAAAEGMNDFREF